jgi:Rrf2 family cysteine metabolism transcriptional repressor
MKFSKRINYGLIFLLQLHYSWPEQKAVKELAKSDQLPPKFLEGIAADFRKSGLARQLKEVSFLEVLRCLDPDWEKQNSENRRSSESSKQDTILSFFKQTSMSVDKVFGEIFLDVLPALHTQDDTLMYYI